MSKMVSGLHHVSLKCYAENYEKTVTFYRDLLGLSVIREWDNGMMLDTGSGCIELFNKVPASTETGSIDHFAFECPDVDGCATLLKNAGYAITTEPTDYVLKANPPYPIRMAFVIGPCGERIELFQERKEEK